MHLIYLTHEFHNLSWITEINELFHDILIYWSAPVYVWSTNADIFLRGGLLFFKARLCLWGAV